MESKFIFKYFKDHEAGKLARLETSDMNVPVNLFAEENTDFDLQEDEPCTVQVFSVGSNLEVFADEAAYKEKETHFAPISMIPIGLFPPQEDTHDWEESCHILFSGKVLASHPIENAQPNRPNTELVVETLDMTLYIGTIMDQPAEPGNFVRGVVWIYGDIKRENLP